MFLLAVGRQGKRLFVQVKPTEKVPEHVRLFSPVEYRDALQVPVCILRLERKVVLDILNMEAGANRDGDMAEDGMREWGCWEWDKEGEMAEIS